MLQKTKTLILGLLLTVACDDEPDNATEQTSTDALVDEEGTHHFRQDTPAHRPVGMACMQKQDCIDGEDICTLTPGGCLCDFPMGECGGVGTCIPYPEPCGPTNSGVCGCDGVSYGSACEARIAGVSIASEGDCVGTCSPDTCGGRAADGSCYCDDACHGYGDCCENKARVCGDPSLCDVDSCGYLSPDGSCACDESCDERGDCCANKVEACGDGDLCQAHSCGFSSPNGTCACDDFCEERNDCCVNKAEVCDEIQIFGCNDGSIHPPFPDLPQLQCQTGTQFCNIIISGGPISQSSASCDPLPSHCLSDPRCDCQPTHAPEHGSQSCGEDVEDGLVVTSFPSVGLCGVENCGGQAPAGCSCADDCEASGDCCFNKTQVCGQSPIFSCNTSGIPDSVGIPDFPPTACQLGSEYCQLTVPEGGDPSARCQSLPSACTATPDCDCISDQLPNNGNARQCQAIVPEGVIAIEFTSNGDLPLGAACENPSDCASGYCYGQWVGAAGPKTCRSACIPTLTPPVDAVCGTATNCCDPEALCDGYWCY